MTECRFCGCVHVSEDWSKMYHIRSSRRKRDWWLCKHCKECLERLGLEIVEV